MHTSNEMGRMRLAGHAAFRERIEGWKTLGEYDERFEYNPIIFSKQHCLGTLF